MYKSSFSGLFESMRGSIILSNFEISMLGIPGKLYYHREYKADHRYSVYRKSALGAALKH